LPAVTVPSSSLTIVTKAPPLGAFSTPRAEINGQPVPLNWGTNPIGAPPGVHTINIHVPWLWQSGKAQITVDNSSGPAPTVYYAMPYLAFMRGAIGLQPVKNPGLLGFIAIFVVPLLALALCCGALALFGN